MITIAGASGIFYLLGKACIAGTSAYIGYIVITESDLKDEIDSPLAPVVVFLVVGYLVASIFMTVFSMSTDTIIHCYLVDEILNGESRNVPEPLKEYIQDYRDKADTGCC